MAKEQHDREDLLNDATGYVRRIEFSIPGHREPIFCGFRECGSASVYWTQGDVLQFNTNLELRRGFWRERMVASYKHHPYWLAKSDGRVRLQRTPFDNDELESFVADSCRWLTDIHQSIANNTTKVIGTFPEGKNLLIDVEKWLAQFEQANHEFFIRFAMHPGLAKGRQN